MSVSLFFDIFGRDKGVGKMLDDVGSKAEASGSKLGKVSDGLNKAAVPALAVGTAIFGAGLQFGQMAASAEQSSGAVQTVFGAAASKVEEFASRSAGAVGLSSQQYNELSAVTGTALKAAGVSVDELAGKNDQLITRGADLASVFGGTTAEAVSAMGAAFRGEFDPLERYGLTLTMTQVNAELAARGQDKLGGAAGEAAKKQAILDLIMQQSAGSAGNFAREADTASGAQERSTAAFADAGAKLGEVLLPAMTKFAEIATTVAKWVKENSGLVTTLAIVLGVLAGGVMVATGVMTILNLVMAANPIGAVILAVTALIAIIALLVMNWDKVVKFLSDSWSGFTKWWGDGMTKIGRQWNDMWAGIGKWAKDTWNGFTGFFKDGWNGFTGWWGRGMDKIGRQWNSLWDGLKAAAKAPISFVINTVINDGLIGAFNTVAGWIPGVQKLGRVSIPGFEAGGYTGEGDKDEPAGVVHKGEFVFTKAQTARAGVQNLYRLARTLAGFATGGFVNPVPSAVVSQPYSGTHNGIDLAAPMGTPIRAAFDGTVSSAGWSSMGGGNEIHINHAGGWQTWYAHLSRMLVRAGMTVNRGMRIGDVGSTGNSTGPHLHFMVLQGGWPNHVNPAPYMGAGADIPAGGFNPFAGLFDAVLGTLKGAFAGGEFITQLVLGIGQKLLTAIPQVLFGGTGSTFGPKVFDQGGWLESVGVNRSGKPEAVFTQEQFGIMKRAADLGVQYASEKPYEINVHVYPTPGLSEEQVGRMAGESVMHALSGRRASA